MAAEVRFTVPDGFLRETRRKTVSFPEAEALLRSRRWRRYTSALRRGELCVLTRDKVLCPCCGHRTAMYERFMRLEDDCVQTARRGTPPPRRWGERSLFPEDDLLRLNEPWRGDSFTCPRCGAVSAEARGSTEAEVRQEGSTLYLTVFRVWEGDVLPLLSKAAAEGFTLRFPLRETVSFHLKNGRSVLTLYDDLGHALRIRDVTYPGASWRCSACFDLLRRSALARRKLAQAFTALMGPLPYKRGEITEPELFLMLTLFRGYDRAFFDALPNDGAEGLHRSFRHMVRRLRDVRMLPSLYDTAGLPEMKSIRKLFFQHPQLFWYLPELRTLWELLGDVNLFRSLLNACVRDSRTLLYLHFYPGTAVFFRDLAAEKGRQNLLKLLLGPYQGRIFNYGCRYAAAGAALRRSERGKWQKPLEIPQRTEEDLPLPVSYGLRALDRVVEGYRFVWLRTRKDFLRAGRVMHNCLGSYTPGYRRVAIVLREHTPQAAVQVSEDCITMALGPRNRPLDENGAVFRALCRWAELSGYRILETEDDWDAPF